MGDSIQDILEEWVFEYHTSGTSPNGVQINFVENAEIFDEELQEEYIDETQPIYEVMIHQESVNEDIFKELHKNISKYSIEGDFLDEEIVNEGDDE